MRVGCTLLLGVMLSTSAEGKTLGAPARRDADARARGASVIDVGDRRQLFIDERFIESSDGIRLTAYPPVKQEIVLRPEGPESNGMFWISAVVPDQGGYLMYYGTRQSRPTRDTPVRKTTNMHVARSKDGLHWKRVPVGRFDVGHGKDNNIVMREPTGGGPRACRSLRLQGLQQEPRGRRRGERRKPQ